MDTITSVAYSKEAKYKMNVKKTKITQQHR